MTKRDMLAAIDREIGMREKVYPTRVRQKFMTQQKATHEIEAMRAIREVVERCVPSDNAPAPQGSLF